MNRRSAIFAAVATALGFAFGTKAKAGIDRSGEDKPVPVYRMTSGQWIEVHPRDLRKGDRVTFTNAPLGGVRTTKDAILAEGPTFCAKTRTWSAAMELQAVS